MGSGAENAEYDSMPVAASHPAGTTGGQCKTDFTAKGMFVARFSFGNLRSKTEEKDETWYDDS